jgi:hypothetical protein
MDLDWFFQQWIYGTYRPNYRYSYLFEEDPGGGWNAYLHIRQVQSSYPQVFTMPIDIEIGTTGGQEIQVVFNDRRAQNFTLHTEDQPNAIAFDPDRWISRQAMWEEYTLHIVTLDLLDGALTESYKDTVKAKGISDKYLYEVIAGTLPDGLSLDSGSGLISGFPTEMGLSTFSIRATHRDYTFYTDSAEFTIEIGMPSVDRPGDANADGEINIGDVVFIVNYIFREGEPPQIPNWADANADCLVNVADAVYLISYIFRGGADPQSGCVQ